jgi:hypothetical protein
MAYEAPAIQDFAALSKDKFGRHLPRSTTGMRSTQEQTGLFGRVLDVAIDPFEQ